MEIPELTCVHWHPQEKWRLNVPLLLSLESLSSFTQLCLNTWIICLKKFSWKYFLLIPERKRFIEWLNCLSKLWIIIWSIATLFHYITGYSCSIRELMMLPLESFLTSFMIRAITYLWNLDSHSRESWYRTQWSDTYQATVIIKWLPLLRFLNRKNKYENTIVYSVSIGTY